MRIKIPVALATLVSSAGAVAADYAGTYQFDDIENATGDLVLRIIVGITQKGTLIGKMQGIAIAIGTIIVAVGLVMVLLHKFRSKNMGGNAKG